MTGGQGTGRVRKVVASHITTTARTASPVPHSLQFSTAKHSGVRSYLIFREMPCLPAPEVTDYVIIAKVVPVAVKIGDIEFGHEPGKTGYYPISDFFYLLHSHC